MGGGSNARTVFSVSVAEKMQENLWVHMHPPGVIIHCSLQIKAFWGEKKGKGSIQEWFNI
jgi:hypothetical protein